MISYLHGKLAYKLETSVVIDTGGVGYEVFMPSDSAAFFAREGEEVQVFTVLISREDEMLLYGFTDRESVRLFRLLLGVSGIGAKAAMAILSAMPVDDAVRAITYSDTATLTKANGVGRKSAERIILELKDRVGKASGVSLPAGEGASRKDDPRAEAIEALLSLGYSRSEAGAAVMGVAAEGELSAEKYVKAALKSMA
ncbi:MAG: Holliday junction branch migration protein RuvA [Clostridiales Family XIII bacterium]|nr:Holliday junction branch migration protein RuvA [Clostridiales Family XIII bacterium]